MKAFLTFASGQNSSSLNYFSDIEFFWNLQKTSMMSRLPRVLMQMNGKVLTNPCQSRLPFSHRQSHSCIIKQLSFDWLLAKRERVFVCVDAGESHGDDEACALSTHWRWSHPSLFTNHQPVANWFSGTICVFVCVLSGHHHDYVVVDFNYDSLLQWN